MRDTVLEVLVSLGLFYNFVLGQTDQAIVYQRYSITNAVALSTTDVGVRSNIDCGVKCSHLETCHFFYYLVSLNMCRLVLSTSIGATNVEAGEYEFYFANGGTRSLSVPFFLCPATSGDQVTVFSQDTMPITFRIFSENVKQPDAFQACADAGETLMKIKTSSKQAMVSLVLSSCPAFSNHDYYLDGRAFNTNIWRYADESLVPMDNTYLWRDSAPNEPIGNNCVRMAASIGFRWEDISCQYKYGFICETN